MHAPTGNKTRVTVDLAKVASTTRVKEEYREKRMRVTFFLFKVFVGNSEYKWSITCRTNHSRNKDGGLLARLVLKIILTLRNKDGSQLPPLQKYESVKFILSYSHLFSLGFFL